MKGIVLSIFLSVLVFAGSAYAQDLTGKWVPSGPKWGAMAGESEHEGLNRKGELWASKDVQNTLEISKQQENAFQGEWCTTYECENLVGVIKSNGKIRMVDEDGFLEAEMDGDKMEVCYFEADDDLRLAICQIMEKE